METWDAIRARRNVRIYDERPIATEQLDRILEAGWRSPSASNRQRLRPPRRDKPARGGR